MSNSGFRPLFHIFWVISLLIAWNIGTSYGMKALSVSKYFPGVETDLSKVTWAHAVNSQAKLRNALKGSVMMLEADIMMGKKEGSNEEVPIMAHPRYSTSDQHQLLTNDSTSDLSFDDFLEKVIIAVEKGKKKGIKLDFKQIEAVKPVLKQLKDKKSQISFPIMINADISQGPVNSTKKPVDAVEFLKLFNKYVPKATLSVGWTTRFGYDTANTEGTSQSKASPIIEGKYSSSHVKEMLQLLTTAHINDESTEITFPVRAGIASQSIDEIMHLIGEAGPKKSITIWSPVNDPVDMEKLNLLIDEVGKSRCYIDVPFSMKTGPGSATESPDDDYLDENDRIHPNPSVNGSAIPIVGFSALLLICLAIILEL